MMPLLCSVIITGGIHFIADKNPYVIVDFAPNSDCALPSFPLAGYHSSNTDYVERDEAHVLGFHGCRETPFAFRVALNFAYLCQRK